MPSTCNCSANRKTHDLDFHPRHAPRTALASAGAALAGALLSGCGALLVGGADRRRRHGRDRPAHHRRAGRRRDDRGQVEQPHERDLRRPRADRAPPATTGWCCSPARCRTTPTRPRPSRSSPAFDNVSSVVNELTVGPLNTFGERSKDTYVTTKVKASLVDAKDLFANSIKVIDPPRRRLPDGPRHRARGEPRLRDRARRQRRGQGGPGVRGASARRSWRAPSPRPWRRRDAAASAAVVRARTAAQPRRLIRLEVSARLPPWACRSA